MEESVGDDFRNCLFIWSHWVLVAALRIFDLHCGMRDL